ncbi:MAG: hypothetical protein ACRD0A_08610 [Acidimicrobiales bacterium]
MSTITETPLTPDTPPPARPSRWRLATAISAAVAVVAIGVATFALTRDDGNDTTTIATRDAAATQQVGEACQQWFDTQTTATTTPGSAGWCGYMSDWMYDHMASGQMMGPMMWGNPTAMYDTCVQAMGSYQPGVEDPAQWCQNMVGWMTEHMGNWMNQDWDDWHDDWDNWDGTMNPPMMGR